MTQRSGVCFHGIDLHFRADDVELLRCLTDRFDAFPPADGRGDAVHVDLSLVSGAIGRQPPEGRLIYEGEFASAWYDPKVDRVFADFVSVGISDSRPAEGYARIEVTDSSPKAIWGATRPLFTMAFVEILKRRNLFFLHASAIATQAGAIVFPGPSGSGKSTLALALARAGFTLLGDDVVFLRRSGSGGAVVLPFPDEIDLTDHSKRLL